MLYINYGEDMNVSNISINFEHAVLFGRLQCLYCKISIRQLTSRIHAKLNLNVTQQEKS